MSKRDKLVERIRRRPASAKYSEVRSLLESYGWAYKRTRGSHVSFKKPGERALTVPVHNDMVERVYLDMICVRLGLDAENEAK